MTSRFSTESAFAEIPFVAAESFFDMLGGGENFVIGPWTADNLHSNREAIFIGTRAHDRYRPTEKIEVERVNGVDVIASAM